MNIKIPFYTKKEEFLNTFSHIGGFVLAFIFMFLLISKSDNSCEIYCSIIFSFGLICLYLSSSIYHGTSNLYLKKIFRIIDHINVFVLEATSFVPICFLVIDGKLGITYFTFVLVLNIVGIFFNIFRLDKVQIISVVLHLTVGWSVLFFLPLLLDRMKLGVFYLILGGFLYSIGVIFYRIGVFKKYFHFIFHLFCLGGSICHFIMIYLYII